MKDFSSINTHAEIFKMFSQVPTIIPELEYDNSINIKIAECQVSTDQYNKSVTGYKNKIACGHTFRGHLQI